MRGSPCQERLAQGLLDLLYFDEGWLVEVILHQRLWATIQLGKVFFDVMKFLLDGL